MASTVMATKPIALAKASPSLSPRKISIRAQAKPSSTSIPNLKRLTSKLLFSVPSIAMLAATPLPALAEMEKAGLFDFNLTLPIIAIEFLLLMVALDKLYFSPLGAFMDARDAKIRAELSEVKDTSAEVKELEEKAVAVMRAARAEIAAALSKMKKEMTAELEVKLAEEQARIELELAAALNNLEKEKEEALRVLDAQIDALSEEIVRKVLPTT
ncbi:ATP synthase subunit b [Rhynchospora pubera]|uniref:ATP synthase subunit b n=1 Tax=Rhynchospora pubera TaxID=906938 RepID=A0AAV8G1L8_9POAL|nr:ATP synthase subunit b [Rhynchospora pubera]